MLRYNNEDIENLEREFKTVEQTATEVEQKQLRRQREVDEGKEIRANYGHDLLAAIGRGYSRKQIAAIDEFGLYTEKRIRSVAGPKPETAKLFWHMLMALIRWGQDLGMSAEVTRASLVRASEVVERRR